MQNQKIRFKYRKISKNNGFLRILPEDGKDWGIYVPGTKCMQEAGGPGSLELAYRGSQPVTSRFVDHDYD